MSIHILFGPGGAGKSYFQTRLIYRELIETERNVVTNLALDVPALSRYIEKQTGRDVRIGHRLRILTRAESEEFWKYRGPLVLRPGGEPYDYVQTDGKKGCLYVIDEAGVCGFSALGWAQMGQNKTTRGVDCCWYLDQQRKFNDDVYASANGRAPTAIAKGFRDKAHAFLKLRNGYLRQMGVFRARGRFECHWFSAEPTSSSEAFRVDYWELDASGLADCYRTEDGMGVAGTTADKGRRAKGIPVLWAFPAAIALGGLCILIPWLLGRGVKSKIAPSASAPVEMSAPTAGSLQTARTGGRSDRLEVVEEVAGVVIRGNQVLVALRGSSEWLLAERREGAVLVLAGGARVLVQDVTRGASRRAVPASDAPGERANRDPLAKFLQ